MEGGGTSTTSSRTDRNTALEDFGDAEGTTMENLLKKIGVWHHVSSHSQEDLHNLACTFLGTDAVASQTFDQIRSKSPALQQLIPATSDQRLLYDLAIAYEKSRPPSVVKSNAANCERVSGGRRFASPCSR